MSIGRLQRVPLREVWPNEAYDFTPWLQANLDVLNEALDLELSSAEREQAAGSFSLDLLAEDSSGNPVIIENQLERSNHDHLGKLLTYLVAFDASTAVWIVQDARPEHVAAIHWLNESSSGAFYLVKVEAVRIGDSAPAPVLTRIVGPSLEARGAGDTKRDFSERHELRYQFWESLLALARTRTQLHQNISPSSKNWIQAGVGISRLSLNYVVLEYEGRVELYISTGDAEQNKQIFDALAADRDAINARAGVELSWERRDEQQASKIAWYLRDGGYRDENWEPVQLAMVNAMIRLEAALRPYLSRLR